MAIEGIGSMSGNDPAAMAEVMLKRMDANRDGGVDRSELRAAMKNTKARDVEKVFSRVDTNTDGKIDQAESQRAVTQVSGKGGATQSTDAPSGSASGKAGGGPPPGGGGGGGAAGGAGNSSESQSASADTAYDPRDTNKDGVVSIDEQIAYETKHPEKQKNSQVDLFA